MFKTIPSMRVLTITALAAPFCLLFAGETSAQTETSVIAPISKKTDSDTKKPDKSKKKPKGKKGGGKEKPVQKDAPAKPAPSASEPAKTDTAAPNAKAGAPAPKMEDSPEIKAIQKQLAELAAQKSLIEARLALEEMKQREAVAKERQRLGAPTPEAIAAGSLRLEEKNRIENELALETSRAGARLSSKTIKLRELEAETRIIETELKNAALQLQSATARQNAELAIFQKKQEAARVALNASPKYLKEPLVNGTLHISDRRVSLNGVVTLRMARHAIERINFYNNQSTEHPIFLVIDRSPGGSVAAGFQILKAMESSKAPVHVVVKGYAASMAAVITTLAKHSYAYNNTIILHHQMSTMLYGNMTDLDDQIKVARNWYSRLATAVAKKMGISLEEFTKQMYSNFASGDWEEFGDNAKRLKWVDNIVDRMVETSVVDIRQPAPPQSKSSGYASPDHDPEEIATKLDEKGRPYTQLPMLDAFDAWWIYDKRNQYRAW
ncbi:MAG: ATP-dependent Clp protease proteolytic subunit [Puniceicoccales bacterium]|jgi:ATP-dependent Clp protease protease subunit|nr:ATP-dependent Clp protease proteolytic subunit [Puniceicoccales bacterium]